MFEEASRRKIRFATPFGQWSVDDLWDMPLAPKRGAYSLNELAIALHHQVQEGTLSFIDPAGKPDPAIQLSFDIVKHIIEVRQTEARKAAEARAIADRKQKILGIMARKEDATLEAMSTEELRGLIEAL
jgi:hypothetical protein